MHHEEGHRSYFLRDVIRVKTSRRVRQLGRVVCMGNVHKYVAWKLEGNNPLVRPSHRWEGNIKVDIRGMVFGCRLDFMWLNLGTYHRRLMF
jgi:hypothetical protein